MSDPVGTVETQGLAWGVRESFRRYVLRMARGEQILDGGAGAIADGRYFFPVQSVAAFDPTGIDLTIAFGGGVRFFGHGGFINLRLGDLSLQLTSSKGVLRTRTTDGEHDLVEVEVTDAWVDGQVNGVVLASRLAAGAEPFFDDVYPAGTPFDDLEVRFARTAP